MSREFGVPLDAAQRAALAAGKTAVHLCPPAGWLLAAAAAEVPWPDAPGLQGVVIVPEAGLAAEVADALAADARLAPVHALTGHTRSERLLRAGQVRTLVGAPADLVALIRRAALKLESVATLLVAWPEAALTLDHGPALDTLLQEGRPAARLIAVADAAAAAGFLERHAFRAPRGGPAAPAAPGGPVRYAVVPWARRAAAVREALDQLNPATTLVWEPLAARAGRTRAELSADDVRVTDRLDGERAALAVALDLPTGEALAALRAQADDVLVLVGPHQLGALAALAHPLRPLQLVSDADRARDRGFHLRSRVRARLEAGDLDAELLALAPLLDAYDPARVAAAALALVDAAPAGPATDLPAWVRLHLSVGRKDNVRPADIVGGLLNSVGMARERVGRVEIRETFSLVEVRAEDAEAALRGLQGLRLRGRAVQARLDRH